MYVCIYGSCKVLGFGSLLGIPPLSRRCCPIPWKRVIHEPCYLGAGSQGRKSHVFFLTPIHLHPQCTSIKGLMVSIRLFFCGSLKGTSGVLAEGLDAPSSRDPMIKTPYEGSYRIRFTGLLGCVWGVLTMAYASRGTLLK